jgi:hypothetical protein
MSEPKTSLLLPHRIPASKHLLGLTTINPLSPLTSETVPEDIKTANLAGLITPEITSTTISAPGTLTLAVSSSLSFNLDLQPVLNIASSRGPTETFTIVSKEIQKIRLENPAAVFRKVLEKPGVKNELIRLLSKRVPGTFMKPTAYFIVGLVTAVDAQIKKGNVKSTGFKADAKVPIELSAGGLPGAKSGFGVGLELTTERTLESEETSVGAEIWGVEYMKVHKSRWGEGALGLGSTVEKVKGGRFFGKNEEEDESDEDNEEITWNLTEGMRELQNTDGLKEFVAVIN